MKSVSVKRKKAGRPATGTDPLYGVRFSKPQMLAIEKWAKLNRIKSRSEAIRRLVEQGLAAPSTAKPTDTIAGKAADKAAQTIDKMADRSIPPEEQASRKRRLLKGPKEFRDMRTDLPKRKR